VLNINGKEERMALKQDRIDLTIRMSINRRCAWIAFVLFVCIFALLESSLNGDVQMILLQSLLWTLQTILLGKPIRDHTLQ
jgi:hypothetical protein